jgi:hypothetical protein
LVIDQKIVRSIRVDRHDVVITELSDEELVVIATGGRTEVTDTELLVIAAGGRCEDEMKVIPPPLDPA